MTVTPTSSHLLSARLNLTAILYSNVYFVQANASSQTFLLFAKSPKPQLVTPDSTLPEKKLKFFFSWNKWVLDICVCV